MLFAYTFSQLTITPHLLWKGPRIHIFSVIFVISMIDPHERICLCPYSFVNITVIPVHFFLFHFCFKFYYPVVNIIVNHRYLVYFRSRKTNTKSCMILAWLVRSLASNIVVSKSIVFWSMYVICKYIDFTRFLYKIFLNR